MIARLPLPEYDLAATLGSGQVFRWRRHGTAWEGVLGSHWIRLRQEGDQLHAESATPDFPSERIRWFLGLDEDLPAIRATFPEDAPMRSAVAACPGLRLLRQDPWECLASFILSSTKQIVQIQQCVALLCERHGDPVATPPGHPPARAFPVPERLANAGVDALRDCKLGFRARYLGNTAQEISRGTVSLEAIAALPTPAARDQLMQLPGVGRKIADCVLLFAYGRQDAFPVDVWVLRALRHLYFPGRRPSPATLLRFTETHFGPYAGYAQQYLFHYVRTHLGRAAFPVPKARRHARSPSPRP